MSAPDTRKGGRPKGQPKSGGRKKGTPNRTSLALREKLEAIGCDPGEGLAKIAEDLKTPLALRLQAYSMLMPYVYARRKATDDSNREPDAGDPHAMTKEEALEFARDLIALFSPGGAPPRKLPPSVSEGEPKPSVAQPGDES
jgi:hypothetical protein